MSRTLRLYLQLFLSINMIVGSIIYLQGFEWFISFEVGFISSLFVTLSSYFSYKSLIQRRIEVGDLPKEARDELDMIDDLHDLYSEDEEIKEVDFAQVIAEEKLKQKGFKNAFVNLKKTIFANLSLLRVFSYVSLVVGFLYLNNNELLNIFGYMIGISLVWIVALIVGFLL
ncbi:MAG TPA: hypothetical protein EYG69_01660 [Campylobacterales bacterium]|nr:hypothetical protein [Campylobacterales bacterium]